MNIINDNKLVKIDAGWINSDEIKYDNFEETIKNLGLDWMNASKEEIEKEV